MQRTIIIGDVHGCLSELQALLDKIGPTPTDHLVFVGDLVDKGPDPVGVVRFLHQYKTCKVTLIRGNHEDSFIRYHRNLKNPVPGKTQVKDPRGERAHLYANLSDAEVAWLAQSELYLKLPEYRALVVHGGVMPSLREDDFVPASDLSALKGYQKDRIMTLLRCRHVDVAGHMVPLGSERPVKDTNLPFEVLSADVRVHLKERLGREGLNKIIAERPTTFWANVYDGRFGHVFFGHAAHDPRTEPIHYQHATAIDHGCVYGIRLSAAVLSDTKVEIVSVQSQVKYAQEVQDA